VDMLLVGDSLGMVIQGHRSTVPVTVEDMAYHCFAVCNGLQKKTLVMCDMPFMSYGTPEETLKNAACLMRDGRAHMVKMEGGEWLADSVRMLTDRGVPVCGHLGLTPQSVYQFGGFRIQGRTEEQFKQIKQDAQALQDAGASMLILECVPTELSELITEQLTIPTIGIGAGKTCDGQILVTYDMLNLPAGKKPRFVRNFMEGAESMQAAVEAYVQAVKNGEFPGPEHSFGLDKSARK
ncbi:MAG: 3-methyl-2-oxobutanoate hydroxymethyltransferase, partial [Pseudomonadota bacterium]